MSIVERPNFPGIFIDQYGNSASITHFGSKEKAIAAIESLKNCSHCSNCSNCNDCYKCFSCSDCVDSEELEYVR